MTPVYFKEQNVVYGEGQNEYIPLPAHKTDENTITCWKLTWWELLTVLWTRRIWLWQKNFSMPLQAQLPTVENPFN